MVNEQKFKIIEEQAQERVHKAQARLDLVKRVFSNCRGMQYSLRYEHLLDLNARGVHLEDPVYQKLDCFYRSRRDFRDGVNEFYVRDALCRIGNRTMTEEEYYLLSETIQEEFKDICFNRKFKDLMKKINNQESENGGVSWAQGPFFAHRTPRNKEDLYHESRELGYNREDRKENV